MGTNTLTLEEERQLVIEMQSGDEDAKRKLSEAHLCLVNSIAGRYQHSGVPKEDLVLEGCIGLEEATKDYSLDKGARFSTHSYYKIRKHVLQAIETQSRIVRWPANVSRKLSQIRRYEDKGYSSKEISYLLNISEEKMRKLFRGAVYVNSLEQMSVSKEDRDSKKPESSKKKVTPEFLGDVRYSPEKPLFENERRKDVLEFLDKILSKKQAAVLKLRLGFMGEPHTLEETGDKLGVTKEAVRQVQDRALSKLKKSENKKILRDLII